MLTTTFGYEIPETLDRGGIVFPALQRDIQRVNDHNHEGTNSQVLTPKAFGSSIVTLLAANWVSVGNGVYKQAVTMPSGLFMDQHMKEFRLADGSIFYPTVVKTDTAQYEVYINDPSQEIKVIYK